ncbi:trypsin-like serine protease [Methylibium rhizosphaerae]|uniref:trypsin-like serine protease n=1 Tax=Methylibium rhizosphaerae TaxID=2570323 RepID=UPI0015E3C02F|nr:trypsin-like serine protease [Methylibium rhizosphaerae]
MKRVAGRDLSIQVIGGAPADPAVWPATLVFRDANGAGCTATVIGSRVVLTAAHCMRNGEAAIVDLPPAQRIGLVCDHHPDYPANYSADFALCIASAPLDIGADYEVIASDVSLHKSGRTVVLLGYGCITQGGTDKNFGQLFQGAATVTHAEANEYVVSSGAAVCFGDSGGAVYSPDGVRRRVIAVNSRGDISQFSWLSLTTGSLFRRWALKWRHAEGARLCGIHADATNCHQ